MQKRPSPPTRVLSLHLRDLFPLCDVPLSPSDDDKKEIINAAYQRLFEDIIPGFNTGEVLFVLAEVLELDRETSRPRILVYSNKQRADVAILLNEYFEVIGSLREDEWSISKADALYTGSRIWCAETLSSECQIQKEQRSWEIFISEEFPRSYEFEDHIEEEKELKEIELAFNKYLSSLYELHLKNYPCAYVMLIPIFLGSMYGNRKSRKKLGAIFLHFATTKRITNKRDLLRIYGRTLLFWHYYFTSEAVERRQAMLEESDRRRQSLETDAELFKRISPFINEIRMHLAAIRQPISDLEAQFDPTRLLILGGGDVRKFFQAGPPIEMLQRQITPKHDWAEGDVDTYKTLVAGILIRAFQLEKETIDAELSFWEEMSRVLSAKAPESASVRELVNFLPALKKPTPSDAEVKEIFKIIKSWYSDAFKIEKSPGLPITMLEFAFKTLGSKFETESVNERTFWVASETPVRTIEALGFLHEKHGIARALLRVDKERSNGRLNTDCTLTIDLEKSHWEVTKRVASLTRLRVALQTCAEKKEEPRGDTTRFLWMLSGGRPLTLKRTIFELKTETNQFEIDFMDTRGMTPRMRMSWRGEIYK